MSLNDSAFEDQFPDGSEPLPIQNIQRFKTFMALLLDPERKWPVMGLATGKPGIGKTITTQVYLNERKLLPHTGLPDTIYVKVAPRSTPRGLADRIGVELKQKIRERQNAAKIAKEVANAIEQNSVKVIIIDEADRLTEDGFDLLRDIYDDKGTTIVIVGLPEIEDVIDTPEKLSSRIGLRMTFLPPTREEFLDLILPKLTFARWQFDPQKDAELGEILYRLAGNSLRKTRNLLVLAGQIAKIDDAPYITLEQIRAAQAATATKLERLAALKQKSPKSNGTAEKNSEERNDYKHRSEYAPDESVA